MTANRKRMLLFDTDLDSDNDAEGISVIIIHNNKFYYCMGVTRYHKLNNFII